MSIHCDLDLRYRFEVMANSREELIKSTTAAAEKFWGDGRDVEDIRIVIEAIAEPVKTAATSQTHLWKATCESWLEATCPDWESVTLDDLQTLWEGRGTGPADGVIREP